MRLDNLIDGLGLALAAGPADVDITDLCDDSRQATPGCAFIARGGVRTDGNAFIADALQRGAAAIISERFHQAVDGIGGNLGTEKTSWIVAPKADQALAGRLAERIFGYPSRKLKLIGVTGTNGKTTIAFLIQHLLGQAGWPCGMIGTVVIDDGKQRRPANLTTPGAIDFSRFLAAMAANGCRAAVAEVSSHALDQGRTDALKFDAAVFTNLTGDHLDYHQTMENYARAKARLFESLAPQAFAIINADDPWAPEMVRNCRAHVMACGIRNATDGGSDEPCASASGPQAGEDRSLTVAARYLKLNAAGSRAVFEGPWGSQEIEFPLVGRHNVMNALQAVAAANAICPLDKLLRQALRQCPAPPGRLELVRLEGAETGDLPTVLVDYAHTHDALENVLRTLRQVSPGKLTVVFGCGGDRDRTKRPKMAEVACRLADRIVITSDNPRTEDPQRIIDEILAGVPAEKRGGGAGEVLVEPDRAAAIAQAIASATGGEVVLLAGKGHEDYQIIGTTRHHFDDREQAAAALRRRTGAAVSCGS